MKCVRLPPHPPWKNCLCANKDLSLAFSANGRCRAVERPGLPVGILRDEWVRRGRGEESGHEREDRGDGVTGPSNPMARVQLRHACQSSLAQRQTRSSGRMRQRARGSKQIRRDNSCALQTYEEATQTISP